MSRTPRALLSPYDRGVRTLLGGVISVLLASSGCADDEAASGGGSSSGASQGGAAVGGSGVGGAGGSGGGSSGLCDSALLAEPATGTTYYVAVEEPGADNDLCDGLAPTDEGGGRCPFKDFTSPAVRGVLDGASDVRLEVRAGTYRVEGWEGIRVTGSGASAAAPAVLSAYPGEAPILDVAQPDGAGCTDMTAPSMPECVREVVRVSGTHTIVQGLTIRNGLGYQLEVVDGTNALIRCNRFEETVVFPSRSDQVKLTGASAFVEVRWNEFTAWRSQAIDMTRVTDVLVEQNDFHHPADADGGAVGMKLGTSRVVIRDNDIHDFGADPTNQHAFSLGGEGAASDTEYLAYDIEITENRIWNVPGILAQLVSCRGCAIRGNSLWDSGGGVVLSASALGDPQCATSPTGCPPSLDPRIEQNRMRSLLGDGSVGAPEIPVWSEAGAAVGLVAGENLYCANVIANVAFGWEGVPLDFDAWKTQSGTDATSMLVPGSDAACAGW